VDGDPTDLSSCDLDLADMKACPDLDPEVLDRLRDGAGTPHSLRGYFEGREHAIARGVDLAATEVLQLITQDRVMPA
jgi:hypothetical protein